MAEGGLDALLMLLRSSQNTTILRVASGAIANLAMNGTPESLHSLGLLEFKNGTKNVHLMVGAHSFVSFLLSSLGIYLY